MLTRRSAFAGIVITFFSPTLLRASVIKKRDFLSRLDEFRAHPDWIDEARTVREGLEWQSLATRGVIPRLKPSKLQVSDAARELIVTCEVTSSALYEQRYQSPIWPKGDSGLTIGIGYDLGYVDFANLQSDWANSIKPSELALLKPACGVKGPRAAGFIAQTKGVRIPWRVASAQFNAVALPRYVANVDEHLQNCGVLSPDCLGALTSLVYNRGASFRSADAPPLFRYREMRAIREHMAAKQFDRIPSEIRSMARIWPNNRGLRERRALEALLFEQGL